MDVANGKPSWDNAPEWANWLAQDANGDWYWYKERPIPDSRDHIWTHKKYGYKHERALTPYIKEWYNVIERRPEGGTNGTVD